MTSDNSTNSKIEKIRPKKLVDEAKNAYLKDVEFYKLNKDKFTSRSCPGCEEKNSSYFCTKESFTFERCKSCLTIFMNPGPTADLVDELYKISENYKYWSQFIYPTTKEKRHELLHTPRARWILESLHKYIVGNTKINILELGAGDGGTLRGIHEIEPKIELYAYEPNPASSNLIDKGFITTFHYSDFKNEKSLNKFSVITSFEVLEHTLIPSETIKLASNLLKSGGLLMCSTPNSLSLEVGALKENSTTLDLEHISILSPIAIQILCREHGFTLLEIETPGEFDIELIENGLKFCIFGNFSNNQKKEMQNVIKKSHVSSHLRFVAMKK